MKKSILFPLLIFCPLNYTYGIDRSQDQAQTNKGWKEKDKKIFIYKAPPYTEIYRATIFLCGSLFYSSLIFFAPKPHRTELADFNNKLLILSSALSAIPATYFGYKAFKKRNQAKDPFIILSSQGFEDGEGSFYPWRQVESISIYSSNYHGDINFHLKNNQTVTIDTTEMAISDETLMDLIQRFKLLFRTSPILNLLDKALLPETILSYNPKVLK